MINSALAPNIPGPSGNRFFGRTVFESRRDPLNFMLKLAREHGDLSTFRIGSERIYFVNHPEYVRDVFINHYDHFRKGRGGSRAKHFLGQGLLLSEGDAHRQQKNLMLPAFHRQRIASYAAEMSASALRTAERWEDGETVDMWDELRRLTIGIAGRTLFSVNLESESDKVAQAIKAAFIQYRAFKLPFAHLYERLPLPTLLRFQRGKKCLRTIIIKIIEERSRTDNDHGDLLSMLMLAEKEGTNGQRLTTEEIWDQMLTLFIAGYDSMATVLMWTWYLLSQNEEAEARLHEEVDSVLAGRRAAVFDDLKSLPYTERVLLEAMRLYPPTWRLVRRAIKDFRVGDYLIPAGALVICSQYVMHRDPRYFADPLRFDPERWTEAAQETRPYYSFFPFGGGPRRCLGQSFAMVEGTMVLATLARHWRMRLKPGHPIELLPQHILRSRHGMLMRLERREA